jgi:EAL domain-containing protein (putative c-di-GMP-specific phosphodiesterase class I)
MELPTLTALEILAQKNVSSLFQPILSIKKMGVVGLEALAHGVKSGTQEMVPPQELYRELGENKSKLALDRLFRDKGLEGFVEIQSKVPDLLLFLNIESSILTPEVVGSGHLVQRVQSLRLNPSGIVIEISPSENMNMDAVLKFVEMQRSNQFLIALEDVNNTGSCVNQILSLYPDLVKLDASFVQDMGKDPFKREGIKTVVNLAHKLGALVIANGVENEEDALCALELGVDMLQGGYFSKPKKSDSSTLGLKARIVFLGSRYRRMMTDRMNRDKDLKNRCLEIALALFQPLQKNSTIDLDEAAFTKYFLKYPQLECLYILSQDGVQVSETFCNLKKVPERRQHLFQPAPKGTDHSLKEYYYALTYNNLSHYLTDPYISLASGNLCITFSGVLTDKTTEKAHIFCADIDVSQI